MGGKKPNNGAWKDLLGGECSRNVHAQEYLNCKLYIKNIKVVLGILCSCLPVGKNIFWQYPISDV